MIVLIHLEHREIGARIHELLRAEDRLEQQLQTTREELEQLYIEEAELKHHLEATTRPQAR